MIKEEILHKYILLRTTGINVSLPSLTWPGHSHLLSGLYTPQWSRLIWDVHVMSCKNPKMTGLRYSNEFHCDCEKFMFCQNTQYKMPPLLKGQNIKCNEHLSKFYFIPNYQAVRHALQWEALRVIHATYTSKILTLRCNQRKLHTAPRGTHWDTSMGWSLSYHGPQYSTVRQYHLVITVL